MILLEIIKNPPRNLKKYIDIRFKDLNLLLEYSKKLYQIYQYHLVDSGKLRDIEYALDHYSTIKWENLDSLNNIIEGNRINFDYFKSIKRSFEYALDSNDINGIKYIINNYQFESNLRNINNIKEIFDNHYDEIKQAFDEYGFDENNEIIKKYIDAIEIIKLMVPKIISLFEMVEKLETLEKRNSGIRNSQWTDEEYKPEHEKIETLFHATVYANDIAKDGFQSETPEDRQGIGSYGRQNTISFTHDLYIAKEIARCLKEICMIANNQVKLPQILDWIKRENPETDIYKLMREEGVSTKDKNGQPIIVPPEKIVRIYNKFLWSTNMRSNPVFANLEKLIQQLKGKNPKNIGILSCEIDMSKSGEYLPAEREFRVPASAVLSVKRIL